MLEDIPSPPTVSPTTSTVLQPPTKDSRVAGDDLTEVASNFVAQRVFTFTAPAISAPWKKHLRTKPSQSKLTTRRHSNLRRHSPVNPSKETSLEEPLFRHGRVSHMVLTDASYKVFKSQTSPGALCYKFHKGVAVICGDPLCEPSLYGTVLEGFHLEHNLSSQKTVYLGMSETFRQFAEQNHWIALNFGVERNINPSTNPILAGTCSKRIYTQSRQLLDPKRGGMELLIYKPAVQRDEQLEMEMMDLYEEWRSSREESGKVQSYLSLLDFHSYPGELFYLYAKDKDGRLHGFGGLRRLVRNRAYHFDSCIVATSAQRGLGDLLTVASMALMKSMDVCSLSLGYEPSDDLTNGTGIGRLPSRVLQSLYSHTNQLLQLEGKRQHNDRFKPDDTLNEALYLVFPATKLPQIQQLCAVTWAVHLDIQKVVKSSFRRWVTSLEVLPTASWSHAFGRSR